MMKLRHAGLGILCALALVACGKGEKAKEAGTSRQRSAPRSEYRREGRQRLQLVRLHRGRHDCQFEKETGIKVNYDVYRHQRSAGDQAARGQQRLRHRGSLRLLPRTADQGRRVPASSTSRSCRISGTWIPEIMQRVALHDPGNAARRRLHVGHERHRLQPGKDVKAFPNAPVDSWALVFDPENAAKLKGCGIACWTRPAEISATVLSYLGKDPNSQTAEDLAQAEAKLLKIRPYIRNINSSQYIEDLANGEICVAVGYSGDVLQARDRADEAEEQHHREVCRAQGRHDHLVRHAWRSRRTRRTRTMRTPGSTSS